MIYHAKYGNCFIFNTGLQEKKMDLAQRYTINLWMNTDLKWEFQAENPKYYNA